MARTSTTEVIKRTVMSSTTRGKRGFVVMEARTPQVAVVIRSAGCSRHGNGLAHQRPGPERLGLLFRVAAGWCGAGRVGSWLPRYVIPGGRGCWLRPPGRSHEHRTTSNGTRLVGPVGSFPLMAGGAFLPGVPGSTCSRTASAAAWGAGTCRGASGALSLRVAVFLLTWWVTPVTDRDSFLGCTSLTATTCFTPAGRHRRPAHPSKNGSSGMNVGHRTGLSWVSPSEAKVLGWSGRTVVCTRFAPAP